MLLSPYGFSTRITPTDQSIDFPSLYLWLLAVAQQTEFQALSLSSISVSEITTSSTPFLNLHFHCPMNHFRRSLFNYFTTPSKNFNHKNKKTVTFFSDG